MREPLFKRAYSCGVLRITPAHAGTTRQRAKPTDEFWDHPRSCGNHHNFGITRIMYIGSPPLMREPRDHSKFASLLHRITPAHAGTTVKGSNNYANSFTIPKEIYLVSLFKFSFVVQFVHFFI